MLRSALVVALVVVPVAVWAGFSIDDTLPAATPTAQPISAPTTAPAKVDAVLAPTLTPKKDRTHDGVVVRATPAPAESWIISPTEGTLRRVLAKWAARAGWQLQWDAAVDLPVTVTASFDGNFRSAVKRLFLSLSAAEVNLTALMYTGNRVLRVTESGRRAQ